MKRFARILFLILSLFVCLQSPVRAASVQVEEVISPSGLKAWLVHDDKLPLIALHFSWRGGVEQDSADKQGLASLTANLLTEGAGTYKAETFQKKLAENGISMGFGAGRDIINGSIKTLRDSKDVAFELLRLAITKPRFDSEAVDRTRQQQFSVMRMMLGKPDWQARYALFSHIWDGHPYAFRSLGTSSSLKNITHDDIIQFHKNHFAKNNLLIAAVGSITPSELGKAVDKIFGALPQAARQNSLPEAPVFTGGDMLFIERQGTQTEILLAQTGPKRDDPDWQAAEVANYILGGGGFSSRLMKAARDREGLTYGVYTGLAPMEKAGLILGSIDATNEKAGQAVELVKSVWSDLVENGATEEEVDTAKKYLTGSLPLSLTSTDSIAAELLDMQLHNLGRDYLDRRNLLIRAIDKTRVDNVLRRWFKPDSLTVVMVGTPLEITPTFKKPLITSAD